MKRGKLVNKDLTPRMPPQHLKNIYAKGEAHQMATCKDFLQVQKEGEREVKRNTSLKNKGVSTFDIAYLKKEGFHKFTKLRSLNLSLK